MRCVLYTSSDDQKMNTMPPWFSHSIRDGLKALLALRLDGTPSADTIALTRDVWIQVLWPVKQWDESTDVDRLHVGFSVMMVNIDRWPAPKHLLTYLPPREKLPAIAAPKISEAQRKKNMQRLRDIVSSI